MTDESPPFQHIYDLGDLGRAGAEVRLAAGGEELKQIARWLDVEVVEAFSATVQLRKHSATGFSLDADMQADIVQSCVVTLEPVRSHIARQVHRELHLTQHRLRTRPHESIPLGAGAGDDEVPEEIDTLAYDLAAPLLEDLALAIDPYPRAPGVEFAPPEDAPEPRESPFAVLKSLKEQR
jgi:hypothetical protein